MTALPDPLSASEQRLSRIAIIIPCYNEALTIGQLVHDFRRHLPQARVYVFDNNSSDDTVQVARAAGAIVRRVTMQGKGSVVRRMFSDVEADAYVMIDGDGTYDVAAAPRLVGKLLDEGLDMVVGSRVSTEQAAYRFGHRAGNSALTGFLSLIFGRTFTDILSGYRVFSRRYVKSFAAHSSGFEIETELTVHALELHMPVAEVATVYGSRPQGSVSKLNTYRDGFRILLTILRLFKSEKPLGFYSIAFALFALASLDLAVPIFTTYLATGLVPRLPTAVLCIALMLVGVILMACGIILDAVTKSRIEQKRFSYLAVPAYEAAGDA
jgi:glycosyltransferase involved in cell wall biosynthesis